MVGAHRREGQWAGGLPGHLLLRLTDTLEITGTLATITTTLPVTLTNLEQGGQMAVITSTETVTITGTISPTEAISGTGWVGPKGIASLLPPRWLMAPSGLNGGSDPGTSLVMDIDYTYDSLYRLTDALYNGGYYRFEFKYDAVGNRTQMVSQMPSGQMLTTNYSYDIANRLTSVDSITYTWDANGNLLHDGLSAYTYDQANRLTGISGALGTYGFAYNGLGDRMQQTYAGNTTTYLLDIASHLTQVLADGDSTYLYGLGRIGEEGALGWQYHHGDALGSVRQLTDPSGAISLAKSYEPYGDLLSSAGSAETPYGFAGEWTDSYINLIFLRSRYYAPETGRFLTKDVWPGDYTSPMSHNGWLYVYSNPINLIDPSGLVSSEPIHAMIQVHFADTYGAGHNIDPEFFVAGGSKQGLKLDYDPKGNPILIGTPTGEAGYIDIVDITTHQAYEIKHESDILVARAEVSWYISIYNRNPRPGGPPQLTLGTNYKWAPNGWEIIGTNPYYPAQVILTQMRASGVISYKGEYKNKIPVPLPRYVWEWNPDKKTVEKRDRTRIPNWSPYPEPAFSDAIEVCKEVIVIGVTLYILFNPIPDEPLLPYIWRLATGLTP